MSIKLAWEQANHSTLRIWYDEEWAWNEFYEAIEEAKAMAEFADRPVTILHDLRGAHHLPEHPALHYRNWAIEMEPYSYVNIIISDNPILHSMFEAFKHVAGHWGDGYIFVDNIDEAHYIAVGETLEFEGLF